MDFLNKLLESKKLIIGVVAGLIVVIFVISTFSFVNSTRNEGIEKETALMAQYSDNQNELSSYILSFNESLGIADKQSTKLNTIILSAVQGRYDGKLSSAQPGGGSLFSAIAEAYPDLTATTETYAKVQDLVVSGRNAYKNKQTLLLDRVRDYKVWLDSDLIKSFVIQNVLGYPTDRLEVTTKTGKIHGQEALDKISTVILTPEAQDAYDSGTVQPLITPEDSK